MKSIQEKVQKIKHDRGILLLIVSMTAVCIIIGILSFILGRLSVQSSQNESDIVHIEYPALVAKYEAQKGEEGAVLSQNGGQYVASKSGTKYYKLDCSGVSRIKEENKTYFDSQVEAENAGYEPASNCF